MLKWELLMLQRETNIGARVTIFSNFHNVYEDPSFPSTTRNIGISLPGLTTLKNSINNIWLPWPLFPSEISTLNYVLNS